MSRILLLWARLGPDLGPARRAALAAAAGLPDSELQAMARFRRWQDAQARLFGRLLLGRGLAVLGDDPGRAAQLELSAYGQPVLAGGPAFSISHSGRLVVCALCAAAPLGVDVEELRAMDLNDFQSSLTPAEWELVQADPAPPARFLDLWTAKESVLKALGTGLSTPLDRVAVSGRRAWAGGRAWRLTPLDLDPGHKAHLCHPDADYDVVITPVDPG
ncbi:MAG: 4'-phosphopantetheinyl transferase superfamily protein [Pseudomonadota bacterium]